MKVEIKACDGKTIEGDIRFPKGTKSAAFKAKVVHVLFGKNHDTIFSTTEVKDSCCWFDEKDLGNDTREKILSLLVESGAKCILTIKRHSERKDGIVICKVDEEGYKLLKTLKKEVWFSPVKGDDSSEDERNLSVSEDETKNNEFHAKGLDANKNLGKKKVEVEAGKGQAREYIDGAKVHDVGTDGDSEMDSNKADTNIPANSNIQQSKQNVREKMSNTANKDETTKREKKGILSKFVETIKKPVQVMTDLVLPKSPTEEFQVKFQSLLEKNHNWMQDGPEAKSFKEALALVEDGGRNHYNLKVNAAFIIVRDHIMKHKKSPNFEMDPLLLLFCARLYGSIYGKGNSVNEVKKDTGSIFEKLVQLVQISNTFPPLSVVYFNSRGNTTYPLEQMIYAMLRRRQNFNKKMLTIFIWLLCYHCNPENVKYEFIAKVNLEWNSDLSAIMKGGGIDSKQLDFLSLCFARTKGDFTEAVSLIESRRNSGSKKFKCPRNLTLLCSEKCMDWVSRLDVTKCSDFSEIVPFVKSIEFLNLPTETHVLSSIVRKVSYNEARSYDFVIALLGTVCKADHSSGKDIYRMAEKSLITDLEHGVTKRVYTYYKKKSHANGPTMNDVIHLLQSEISVNLVKNERFNVALTIYLDKVPNDQLRENISLACTITVLVPKMTSTVRSFFIKSIHEKLQRSFERWKVFVSVWKIIGEDSFINVADDDYVEEVSKVLLSNEVIAKKVVEDYQLLDRNLFVDNEAIAQYQIFVLRNLSKSLQHYFKSVSEAITWVLPILFDSKPCTRTFAVSSVNRYFESLQTFDIFQVLDVGASNIERVSIITSDEDSGESLNVLVRKIKEACEKWTSQFHAGNQTPEELQRILRCYSTHLWGALGEFVEFPSESEIVGRLKRFSEVESSIRDALFLQNGFVPMSIKTILDGYLAHECDSIVTLFSKYDYLISDNDSSSSTSINFRSISFDEEILVNYRKRYDFELNVGAYFLEGGTPRMFLAAIGFGWTQIEAKKLYEKMRSAIDDFNRIFSGRASFREVKNSFPDAADFHDEVTKIISCPLLEICESEATMVKRVLSLSSINNLLQSFINACEQFGYKLVTTDPEFEEMKTISSDIIDGMIDDRPLKDCLDRHDRLCFILNYSLDECEASLADIPKLSSIFDLFKELSRCTDVWMFAMEGEFIGEEGLSTFYQQYNKVTNEMLGEKSIESKILDAVAPAICCVSSLGSFCSCVTVKSLLKNISKSDGIDFHDLHRLKNDLFVLQTNILQVRSWFTEGIDGMASVLNQFNHIETSGKYDFDNFDFSTSALSCLSLAFEGGIMSGKGLDDFCRSVGFFQHDDESRIGSLKIFLDEYSMLQKITNNLKKVLLLGGDIQMCSYFPHKAMDIKRAYFKFQQSVQLLQFTRKLSSRIHEKNIFLRLFYSKELRYLSSLVKKLGSPTTSEDFPAKLFSNLLFRVTGKEIYDDLETHKAVVTNELLRSLTSINSEDRSSIATTAAYISKIAHQYDVQLAKPSVSCKRRGTGIHIYTFSFDPVFTESHILLFMHQIFNKRLPESFEVLDGRLPWSSQDLDIFLSRVPEFTNHNFVIFHAESLSSLETILHFLSRNGEVSGDISLHLLQTKSTPLPAFPWIDYHLWDESKVKESVESHNESSQNESIQELHVKCEGWIKSSMVFTSPSATGKSRYIRSKMNSLDSGTTLDSIHLNEAFSLRVFLEFMHDRFKRDKCTNSRALHFVVSLSPHMDAARKSLIFSINSLFLAFLYIGLIYDPTSGKSFNLRSSFWQIFIEFEEGCFGGRDPHIWLKQNMPVILQSCTVVEPPKLLDIDKVTRRVCTYLRAFDDGTINRKFLPTRKRILFVLDESGSMNGAYINAAVDNMINLFKSHVQVGDFLSLVTFDHLWRTVIPIKELENESQRAEIIEVMNSARENSGGGTNMYTALYNVVDAVAKSSEGDLDTYIVALTDGASADNPSCCSKILQESPNNLHMIVIGIGLSKSLHSQMRELCRKYQSNDFPTKGFFLPADSSVAAFQEAFQCVASRIPVSQTFELDGKVCDDDCRALLRKFQPSISSSNILLCRFWILFLYRRIRVMDENHDFNYNEEYDELGSSLMKVMFEEAERLLVQTRGNSWNDNNFMQLIYDFSEGHPLFRLICTAPDLMEEATRSRLDLLKLPGFFIPTTEQISKRETLDLYLSQAMGLQLQDKPNGTKHLSCIDKNEFVLTLDFTIKLLNIHERVECKVPCIMEGETGVSKTAITRMYAILRNQHLQQRADHETDAAIQRIVEVLEEEHDVQESNDSSLDVIRNVLSRASDSTVMDDNDIARTVHRALRHECEERTTIFQKVPDEFTSCDDGNLSAVERFLTWFREGHIKQTFFEICVDASIQSNEIIQKFSEIENVANDLNSVGGTVIVFCDEVNTSSVLGLFKEAMIDHTLEGNELPRNLVIIGACNPARSKSTTKGGASREHDLGKEFFSGHYQVFRLPPSMEALKWNYGSLNREQEREFVFRRICMFENSIPKELVPGLTELIISSHEAIRKFGMEHLTESLSLLYPEENFLNDAKKRAKAMVSLRDIQRVFSLYHFFLSDIGKHCLPTDIDVRGTMLLTISLVYYLRLDVKYRAKFLDEIRKFCSFEDPHDLGNLLSETLSHAMNHVIEGTHIPLGIALTTGLKENIFATLICTLSRQPLLIVGPPGTSKTLSVNLVADNANGAQSPSLFYRKLPRLQVFHYQCSKQSTSKEIASVFTKAIDRQKTLDYRKDLCCVFMDEAGLPEESKESLKVLHYFLEGHMSRRCPVSFVAISNHVLDAAKTNRCISLLRPESNEEELLDVVEGVLLRPDLTTRCGLEKIDFDGSPLHPKRLSERLCSFYRQLMYDKNLFPWFETFFGLRDFIHLLKCIFRLSEIKESTMYITASTLIKALEQNFNGVKAKDFSALLKVFVKHLEIDVNNNTTLRPILNVVQDALRENVKDFAYRPRFKIVIDGSEDDSLLRLLKSPQCGSNRKSTLFKLSGMEEDEELEKLHLVTGVKYAALQGNNALLSQTAEVHECFYDLFNLNFRRFSGRGGESDTYFANIAVGGISRPSLVHNDFQCVVHLRESDLPKVPAPFLNRFEKFRVNMNDAFEAVLLSLDERAQNIVKKSYTEVENFSTLIGKRNIYGFVDNLTIESIFLNMFLSVKESTKKVPTPSDQCSKLAFAIDVTMDIQNLCGLDITTTEVLDIMSTAELFNPYLERKIDDHYSGDKTSPLWCNEPSAMEVLDKVTFLSMTKHSCLKILNVTTPEAIFANRNRLPDEIIDHYFAPSKQEHFNLKSFVQNLDKKESKCIIHMKTSPTLFMIPIIPIEVTTDFLPFDDEDELSYVRKFIHDEVDCVAIYHFDKLRNEMSVRSIIDGWHTHPKKNILVMLVDMNDTTGMQEKINFLRSCIDQHESRNSDKRVIIVLHAPSSMANIRRFIYPVSFVGCWHHFYLDSIGNDTNGIDLKSWAIGACNASSNSLVDVLKSAKALSSKAIIHLAGQALFHDCTSRELAGEKTINRRLKFFDRHKELNNILNSKLCGSSSILDIVLERFASMWDLNVLLRTFQDATKAILEGSSQLSLSAFVHGAFQDTLSTYLSVVIKNLNEWRNLEIVQTSSSSTPHLRNLFAFILAKIPLPPLQELMLQQSLSQRVSGLPHVIRKMCGSSVRFPFFYIISSYINEALELLELNAREDDQIFGFTNIDCAKNLTTDTISEVVVLIDEEEAGTKGHLVKEVFRHIDGLSKSSLDDIIERYAEQSMQWLLGCELPKLLVVPWMMMHLSKENWCSHTLIEIHFFIKSNQKSIFQLMSWSQAISHLPNEKIARSIIDSSSTDTAIMSFLRNFAEYFINVLASQNEHVMTEPFYYRLFNNFVENIFALNGLNPLSDLSIVGPIRVMAFLHIVCECNAPTTFLRFCVTNWIQVKSSGKFCDFQESLKSDENNSSLKFFMDVLNTCDGLEEVRRQFLIQLFSPTWLSTFEGFVAQDVRHFLFMVEHYEFHSSVYDVILRSIISYEGNSRAPSPKIMNMNVGLLNLISDHIGNENDVVEPSLYIYTPSWIKISSYCEEASPLQNAFWACNGEMDLKFPFVEIGGDLADHLFLILLEKVELKYREMETSFIFDQLVSLVAAASVLGSGDLRDVRVIDTTVSLRPKAVSILISALVIYIVSKVSCEACTENNFNFLNSKMGSQFFKKLMAQNLPMACLFFSQIVTKRGIVKVYKLLQHQLRRLSWCEHWAETMPVVGEELMKSSARALEKLREAENDEAVKAREFYCCPFCGAMFGVDMINCGSFVCGRNAHLIGGRPEIGDMPVNETYGCGQSFNVSSAPPYVPNQQRLNIFREEVDRLTEKLHNFENRVSIWEMLRNFRIPYIHYTVDRAAGLGLVLPVASVLEHRPESNIENVLDMAMKERSFLKNFSTLPSLIELYQFLNSTFRYILTKEDSKNITLRNLMKKEILSKRFDSVFVSHMLNIWKKVKAGYDEYLVDHDYRTFYECEVINIPFKSIADIPLNMLLSVTSQPTEGDECQDFIFLVMNHIAEKYNMFVKKWSMILLKEEVEKYMNPNFLVLGSFHATAFLESLKSIDDIARLNWQNDRSSFDVQGIEDALRLAASVPMQYLLLDCLREQFYFRESIDLEASMGVKEIGTNDLSKSKFSHWIYARFSDCVLFDETISLVNDHIDEIDIAKFIGSFRELSYSKLKEVLEGIRTLFRVLEFGSSQDIIEMETNGSILNEIFGDLTSNQRDILNHMKSRIEWISFAFFIGYQLATEAHELTNYPLNMTCSIEKQAVRQLKDNLVALEIELGPRRALRLLESFESDILIFYDAIFRTTCAEEHISHFVISNNFCDYSDPILKALPQNLAIKHYIHLRQELHQQKLQLMYRTKLANNAEKRPDITEKCDGQSSPFTKSNWYFVMLQGYPNENELRDDPQVLWFEEQIEPKDVCLTTTFEMIDPTDASINCSNSSSTNSFQLVDDDFSMCSIADDTTSSTSPNEYSHKNFCASKRHFIDISPENLHKNFCASKIQTCWKKARARNSAAR